MGITHMSGNCPPSLWNCGQSLVSLALSFLICQMRKYPPCGLAVKMK